MLIKDKIETAGVLLPAASEKGREFTYWPLDLNDQCLVGSDIGTRLRERNIASLSYTAAEDAERQSEESEKFHGLTQQGVCEESRQ